MYADAKIVGISGGFRHRLDDDDDDDNNDDDDDKSTRGRWSDQMGAK